MNDAGLNTKVKWNNLSTANTIANKDLVSDLTKEPPGFDHLGKQWSVPTRSILSMQGHHNTFTNGISKTTQHVTVVTQIRLFIIL